MSEQSPTVRPNTEIKRLAREHLTGQYTVPVLASLLVSLLPTAFMLPFAALLTDTSSVLQNVIYYLAYFIILILSVVLQAGQSYLHLNLARQKSYSYADLLYAFKNRPDAFILAFLRYLVYLLPFLGVGLVFYLLDLTFWHTPWTILGILVLAIEAIFAFLYSLFYTLIFLLLVENPARPLREVFLESRRLMTGRRKQFFLLLLSFLGLYLLGILSFFVGLLWVNPYLLQSQIVFYLDVKGELDVSSSEETYAQSSFAQP